MELLKIFISAGLYAAALRLAMPIFFAALGEVFAERAGLVNVGLEGMMLAGAFGGVLGAYATGNPFAGLALGIAFGIGVAAIQATAAINLRADQVVSGIAINLTVLGGTSFLTHLVWAAGNVPQVKGFTPLALSALAGIPFLGKAVFTQNLLVYAALPIGIASWWVLSRTLWGLRLRACGEDPRSCDSLGIPVIWIRWQSMVICGALAGLGGVFISLGELYTFTEGMTGGRGFIALAVVIVARWSAAPLILAALLFAGSEAIAFRVQAIGLSVPYELLLALPYVVTLLVYAGAVGRAVAPAALGRPYARA